MAFWHSSAHILGHSMELIYGGWLTIGPPVDDGFYYDMYTGPEACGKARSASEDDFAGIEKKSASPTPLSPTLSPLPPPAPRSVPPHPTWLSEPVSYLRIKTQIAKQGSPMTNRIEVTKDQALEVRLGHRLTLAAAAHSAACADVRIQQVQGRNDQRADGSRHHHDGVPRGRLR